MRAFKRMAAVAMAAGLFLGAGGVAVASASATAPAWARARLTGGDTSVTTAPGIAAALLGHGIVPDTPVENVQQVVRFVREYIPHASSIEARHG